jgi:hypothetical protein
MPAVQTAFAMCYTAARGYSFPHPFIVVTIVSYMHHLFSVFHLNNLLTKFLNKKKPTNPLQGRLTRVATLIDCYIFYTSPLNVLSVYRIALRNNPPRRIHNIRGISLHHPLTLLTSVTVTILFTGHI